MTTSGNGAYGLFAGGPDNTLTNSGTVISEQSYAIFISGNNATLDLLAGSVLQGDVFFNDPDTATLNFGPGLNAVVSIDDNSGKGMIDDEMIITAPNDQYVVDGNTIYVLDGTGFSDTAGATT